MSQNVLSFWRNYQVYFQMALGLWQILKPTLLFVAIQAVVGRLLSFALPGVFPAYKRLQYFRGCLFKTAKCVVPSKGNPKRQTNPLNLNGTVASMYSAELEVVYLDEKFFVKREGNKVSVNGKMLYYIGEREWKKICRMEKRCFRKSAGRESENEVLFLKGCRFIRQDVAIGEVMKFEEVLDDLILENMTLLILNNVWFLPVDLYEKPEGTIPKLLNLGGLLFSTNKKTSLLLATYFSIASAIFSIASAILEISTSLRSGIYRISNKMLCSSVQCICNKLPYSVRRFVYLLFIGVENLMPRNDIRLKVVRCDSLNVVIGGSYKANPMQEATRVDWLDQKEEYEFRCGSSIVMKAKYAEAAGTCTATMQHTSAVFRTVQQKLLLKCPSTEEFMKIGTFLSCLAITKAGSLVKYDRNDNIVHVRKWRESLRDYVDAEFPDIYKLRLHDVIV